MNTADAVYLAIVVAAVAGLAWVLLGPDASAPKLGPQEMAIGCTEDVLGRPIEDDATPKVGRKTMTINVRTRFGPDGAWIKFDDGPWLRPWYQPHVWGEVVSRIDGDRYLIHDAALGYSEATCDAGAAPIPAGTRVVAERRVNGTYHAIQVGA